MSKDSNHGPKSNPARNRLRKESPAPRHYIRIVSAYVSHDVFAPSSIIIIIIIIFFFAVTPQESRQSHKLCRIELFICLGASYFENFSVLSFIMGATDSRPRDGRSRNANPIASRMQPGHASLRTNECDPDAAFGADSVPHYVDSRSVLYSYSFSMLPEPLSERNSVAEFGSLTAEQFDIGMPSVPLQSSCLASVDQVLPTTGFLTTPYYNPEGNETAEEMMFHSPVLRSYHDQSFPGASSMSKISPPTSGTGSFSGAAAGSGASSLRHNRFLEIVGDPVGLDNYGNTCYANSVIQLIYHCAPLRLRLLELHEAYKMRRGSTGFEENTVLYSFCQLMSNMHKANNARRKEDTRKSIPPKSFLHRVNERNPFFTNEQQDAHEFCMFLLNEIMETEQKIMANPKNARFFREESSGKGHSRFSTKSKTAKRSQEPENVALPLQAIMQGKFVSITACLRCESVKYKEEAFLDLSLETRQGCSLLDCVNHYGDPSLFLDNNRLKCDECGKTVNAAKTMHVEELPQFALLIHLKRFCYDPEKKDFAKTAHHVALPMEMDVEEYRVEEQQGSAPAAEGPNARPAGKKDDKDDKDDEEEQSFSGIKPHLRKKLAGVAHRKARFELTGFVAHLGEGPNVGHYFTCTRYGPNLWRRFDDDTVTTMTKREVQQHFGVPIDASGMVTTTAYILLYERVA
eukprot:gene4031-2885_t